MKEKIARLTQTLVFPKPKPKRFKKYYGGKCSQSTFSMPKAKTVTQIRPDDQNKGDRYIAIFICNWHCNFRYFMWYIHIFWTYF